MTSVESIGPHRRDFPEASGPDDGVETVTLGGMSISVVDRPAAARLMIRAARSHRRGDRPLNYTSSNGQVIARVDDDPELDALFAEADHIFADGQSLVFASRLLCHRSLPGRVATTDLFHDVAGLAERGGDTFYMLGSTQQRVDTAAAAVREAYPDLRLLGHAHGYHQGAELEEKLAEIDRLSPDILWLGIGVQQAQHFIRDYGPSLPNVGLIKTAGGLFDHLAGATRRAPEIVQRAGLEWFWRVLQEPRRLGWRYLTTNPRAIYAMLRHSA
ncbi:WecB/TagA/CpsF family glycosyltransferase [Pararhizobium mangrovi]|uniref:WecB/TagA/CpsF family glycosyltransferase n=1 Tax=Pararhizobium mangrovi TaxID=2590452 RepID=A0A506TVP0_9HYPH|nr:WecB/TagA/CpsF family glycosyltransferase [Pararhizobium mangrovi]TPW26142.1 WecB/TagA/CpsF family glycosyltransferase [Pararhizobium mangrovi]